MLKQLHEKEKSELKPEQKLKEKKEESILKAVAGISADGVIQETHKLKQDIGGMLNKLTDRLAAEVNKFDQVQLAIEIKERELKEVYDIEKAKLQAEKQALELQMKNLKEQNEQIAKLSIQQDTAYQKIQDVAVKAIEGASKASSFSDLQHVLSEQVKKKQTNDH